MYFDNLVEAFGDELRKIAAQKEASALKSMLLPAAAGIGLWELGRRANKDRRLGRQVRIQNQSSGY